MQTQTMNILNDLSTFLHLPNKVLTELSAKEILCIGSALHDARLEKKETALLNIGIGQLSVELATMQCKFIPSKELKTVIKRCVVDNEDPVLEQLEEDIVNKLLTVCNEVI